MAEQEQKCKELDDEMIKLAKEKLKSTLKMEIHSYNQSIKSKQEIAKKLGHLQAHPSIDYLYWDPLPKCVIQSCGDQFKVEITIIDNSDKGKR